MKQDRRYELARPVAGLVAGGNAIVRMTNDREPDRGHELHLNPEEVERLLEVLLLARHNHLNRK